MYLDSPDSLSLILERLELQAEIYVNGDFCGAWAVDTSGSRRIPFHLIGDGQAWLHIDDYKPQALSTGDLVLFPHDSTHVLSNSADIPLEHEINAEMIDDGRPVTNMICGFFEFKEKASWPLLEALPKTILIKSDDHLIKGVITSLVQLIVAELKQQEQGYYTVVNQLAYLLFIQVLRQQIETNSIESGLLAALNDKKIAIAINNIHLNPEKKWTLESLAHESSMGRSSFAARFNELVGKPAMQYLTEWRMLEASRLLKKTDLPIIEIAERVAYDNEASFGKAFKKVTGHTPGSVRKQTAKLDGKT